MSRQLSFGIVQFHINPYSICSRIATLLVPFAQGDRSSTTITPSQTSPVVNYMCIITCICSFHRSFHLWVGFSFNKSYNFGPTSEAYTHPSLSSSQGGWWAHWEDFQWKSNWPRCYLLKTGEPMAVEGGLSSCHPSGYGAWHFVALITSRVCTQTRWVSLKETVQGSIFLKVCVFL